MRIYKTKQKNLVLECFQKHQNENLTSENIINFLKEDGKLIGDATVYRHLKTLIQNGNVRKILDKSGVYVYRYFSSDDDCLNHFHLVCEDCGTLIHLECDNLRELYRHIQNEHGFLVDGVKTVFYGKCKNCLKNR